MVARRVSVEDWPRLTRFYGIPPSELAKMPNALLRIYAEELLVLHSEETLLGFVTADMPYSSPQTRSKTTRDYTRWLPHPEPEKLDVNTADGAAIIAGLGIGLDLGAPEVESPVEPT
jgi:hypothetical protein